jgi:hypothetical protein
VIAKVDFCGELFVVRDDEPLVIGREGALAIDDNPYLHRRFLELSFRSGLLWVANVGSAICATVADPEGLAQSWLSPGAQIPLVFPRTIVWFTAGPTTYELEVMIDDAPFQAVGEPKNLAGTTTKGRMTFTPDQKLLILALAEDVLRRRNRGGASIPHSTTAAERLGWTTTKFNRKLDNVCEKLARLGVRGLVGDGTRTASNRRSRLVEYALAARLVTSADLVWLDSARVGPARTDR